MSASTTSREQAWERLSEVSLLLNSAGDTDDLLTTIIEAVTELVGSEAGSLLLFDHETETLRFRASTGSSQETLRAIRVPLADSIAGRVFTSGKPVIRNDLDETGGHFDDVEKAVELRTRSLLAVPMAIEGETTGVLEAVNKRNDLFDEEDLEVLGAFANQAALAIRNARQLAELQAAYSRLAELDEFRSEFMALASHELRTPLSILTQSLGIVREEIGDSEAGADFLGEASAAASRLERIIESMTELESLRVGTSDKPVVPVRILAVVDSLSIDYSAVCTRAGVALEVDNIPGDLTVRSEPDRLQRILSKAFDNALDATSEGDTIRILAAADADGTTIRIEDTGRGLPAAELERVFKDYHQVEDHLTRSSGGLGVGLSVARHLAEIDGANVWIESDGPGEGAAFCLQFPAGQATPPAPPPSV